jgi:3'(2'), 5'-bisphosphate nucleotidase
MAEGSGITADARLLDELTAIVSRAAAAILSIAPGALAPRKKADLSPLTAADEASEAVILAALNELLPGVPVVSEEAAGRAAPGPLGAQFILVDPLDGTRELLAGRDEFTANIAIVSEGQPLLGVVSAPARGLLWRGIVGAGAERLALAPGQPPQSARERRAIHTRARPAHGLVAVVSRSHLDPATEAYLARRNIAQRNACGSSLKFCLLAQGSADLYPRLSPTSEWDVAAGHAVLAAAGGAVTRPDGSPLTYGHPGFRIPAFVAVGDPGLAVAP